VLLVTISVDEVGFARRVGSPGVLSMTCSWSNLQMVAMFLLHIYLHPDEAHDTICALGYIR
jgi:hypothetical protein